MDKESADHDSSCVDHRVVRAALLIEHGGIEHHSAWLLADPLVNFLSIAFKHVQIVDVGVGDNLADRLHGELAVMVTELGELAICGAESCGEPFGVCLEETRDVRCDFSPIVLVVLVLFDLLVRFLEIVVERRVLGDDQVILKHSLDEVLSME